MNVEPAPANALVTEAQGIAGLIDPLRSMIIDYLGYIDINNVAGSQAYIDYVKTLINNIIDGDDEGNQGLTFIIDIIGQETGALGYIGVVLDELDDGAQRFVVESIPVLEHKIIQHEAAGRGIVAVHSLIEEYNYAVKNGTLDKSKFTSVAATQDSLLDIANELVKLRDALLALKSKLP